MGLGISKAAVNLLAVATISFDNASSEIRDSGSALISTLKAQVGDVIYCKGTADNDTSFTVTAALAGALTVTPAPTDEIAGTVFALANGLGGSMRDVFRNGVLRFYSGTQVATADTAVGTATLLLEMTESGGTFVAGSPDNGINLGVPASGSISKLATETWKATGLATGTMGWCRFCGNAADSGLASTTLPRIDMSVGGTSSGADCLVATTAIVVAKVYYANDMTLNFPYQYGA
jgi:hypothetical protein